jgi:hypothetical protein
MSNATFPSEPKPIRLSLAKHQGGWRSFAALRMTVFTLLALFAAPGRAAEPALNIYCWDEYLPKDVLQEFTKRIGIPVTLTLYDSNEAMLAKVASGVTAYDLIFPSEYEISTRACWIKTTTPAIDTPSPISSAPPASATTSRSSPPSTVGA